MALKFFICVLSERHIDDVVELFTDEVKAVDRAHEWMDHYAAKYEQEWVKDSADRNFLYHTYCPQYDDGPRARIVEWPLDTGLLSNYQVETFAKAMAGRLVVCDACDGSRKATYATPPAPCHACEGKGSVSK